MHSRFILNNLSRPYSVRRSLSSHGYYITTPIFYVNASPHIGHVYTLLLADAMNIYQRLKQPDKRTILSTGTDEHGIKIQNAADQSKISCAQLCDQNSEKFRNLFSKYETTVTDFIRTSEPRHRKAVEAVWFELESRGFIYKAIYSGWYSNSEETFVPQSQIIENVIDNETQHFDQNGNQLVWSSEENYMFKFSRVKEQILSWLKTVKPVIPTRFNEQAIGMIEAQEDISISRPKKRLTWGIEVPNDPHQTVYVWLDALTNYLTIVDFPNEQSELKRWPIDCQIFGKDILKFHAIYWPSFLAALSMSLPRKLICHSHWLADSLKISKSRGNVINPEEENHALKVEGLRYHLLRSGVPHSDTSYDRKMALRRVNSELADTYGNLLSRCCAKAINPDQVIPTRLTDNSDAAITDLIETLEELPIQCEQHYENANFYKAVDLIMAALRLNQGLYEMKKPWKLVKELNTNEKSFHDYHSLQAITFEALRICSILLQPIIPKTSKLALDRMNVSERTWSSAIVNAPVGDPKYEYRCINNNFQGIIFPRIKTTS